MKSTIVHIPKTFLFCTPIQALTTIKNSDNGCSTNTPHLADAWLHFTNTVTTITMIMSTGRLILLYLPQNHISFILQLVDALCYCKSQKQYVTFTSIFSQKWLLQKDCGPGQEFWMTDTGKQQCEEWCNQYNTLFIWGFFWGRSEEMNNNCGKTMHMVKINMGFTVIETSKIISIYNY